MKFRKLAFWGAWCFTGMLYFAAGSAGGNQAFAAERERSCRDHRIYYAVIDVGHAAREYGATAWNGGHEYDYNLRFAKELAARLEEEQIPYIFSGFHSGKNTLDDRITRTGPQAIFISIHHDAVQPRYCTLNDNPCESDYAAGYSLFVSSENPYYQESLGLAREIAAGLRDAGLKNSAHHAENIPGEGREWLDKNGVFRYDGLRVLRNAQGPAVLMEVGVIVNPRDEAFVSVKKNRRRYIEAVVTALKRHIRLERRN